MMAERLSALVWPGLLPVFLGAFMVPMTAHAAPVKDGAVTSQEVAGSTRPPVEERQSATRYKVVTVDGRTINYTATAGTLTLRTADGKPDASMFYVAYVADRGKGETARPLTFFYNGGPGASSIWLHMASFAPVRVPVSVDMKVGSSPQLAPNPQTLLGDTDMVFLDAISTGYSDVFDPASGKNYWGNDQDSGSFTQAIRRYIDKNERWASPKYLFGESYGTTRSAITSLKLHESGVELNGVILMSSILNFAQRAAGLDRMAINHIPTYAATAWYHQKVARTNGLAAHVERARHFASGPYADALAKGHWLGAEERDAVAKEMSELTGLSSDYIAQSNLQVMPDRFRKQMMRSEDKVVGGFDTRFVGREADGAGDEAQTDPADDAISAPVISAFRAYISRDLKYQTNQTYNVSSPKNLFAVWDWSHKPPHAPFQNAMADVALDLAEVMRKNPSMKVLSLSGYYDLSTPFFATEYDLSHMMLPPEIRSNLTERHYESGHMIYLDQQSLEAVRKDVSSFIKGQ